MHYFAKKIHVLNSFLILGGCLFIKTEYLEPVNYVTEGKNRTEVAINLNCFPLKLSHHRKKCTWIKIYVIVY